MGLRFWCICFFFNPHFWKTSFFGVTIQFLLLIGNNKMIGVFDGFNGWIFSWYVSTIDTLRGYLLVNGFYWDEVLIWDISWFTSLSLYWTTYLTGTIRGTDEGLAFPNISDRFLNASLCSFTSLTSALSGAGFCSE